MKSEEWKKELTEKCDNILAGYREVFDCIEKMPNLDIGDTDPDELGTFMVIKLSKLNKKIAEMSNE